MFSLSSRTAFAPYTRSSRLCSREAKRQLRQKQLEALRQAQEEEQAAEDLRQQQLQRKQEEVAQEQRRQQQLRVQAEAAEEQKRQLQLQRQEGLEERQRQELLLQKQAEAARQLKHQEELDRQAQTPLLAAPHCTVHRGGRHAANCKYECCSSPSRPCQLVMTEHSAQHCSKLSLVYFAGVQCQALRSQHSEPR